MAVNDLIAQANDADVFDQMTTASFDDDLYPRTARDHGDIPELVEWIISAEQAQAVS